MTVIHYDFRNKTKGQTETSNTVDQATNILADFETFCLSQNNVMQLMKALIHKLMMENQELKDKIREMQ